MWWLQLSRVISLLLFFSIFSMPVQADDFFDRPQTLRPTHKRTEADLDRLQAETLVMQARILERRGQIIPAIRKYQRAWRLDSEARAALRQIVPIALQLGRVEEATRYALLLTDSDLEDPFLAERMAMLMADQLEYDRSLQLYQHVLQLRAKEPESRDPIAMHFEMGRLYFLTDKHEQAAQSFSVVLAALEDPDNKQLSAEVRNAILAEPGLAYNLIAESFLEAGRYDEAQRLFEKAAESRKAAGWLTFQLARVDYRAGRYRDAEEKLQEYVKQKLRIGGRTPYELLQSLMEKAAQPNKDSKPSGIAQFRDWLAEDPENFPLLSHVADLTRQRGVLTDAAELYEKSLSTQPTLEGYRGLIATYRLLKDEEKLLAVLGQVALRLMSFAEFSDEVKLIVEERDLLDSLLIHGRNQAATDEQHRTGVALACGLLAIAAERYDVAEEFFAAIPKTPQLFGAYENWGMQLMGSQKFAEAAQVFQTTLDKKIAVGNEAVTLYYLAGALQLQGKSSAALEAANQAAELAKDIPEITLRPAWILYNANRLEQARAAYQQWLDKHAENYASPMVRDSVRSARFALSSICLEQKRIDEAIEWLEQVLDEYPRDVGASNDLGYLLADQNRSLERATKMIRLAVEAEPNNSAYRDSLGWALYRSGKYDEAIVQLQMAASDETPDPIILDHLADALLASGDASAADATWHQAIILLEEAEIPKTELISDIKNKRSKHSAESK